MARRSIPPPPAVFLAPPAFLDSPADKEEKQRQQKIKRRSNKEEGRQVRRIQRPFRKRFPQGNCGSLSLPVTVHHH